MKEYDLATVCFADFSPYLNKEFSVEFQGGQWPFTLASGSERTNLQLPNAKRPTFSVTFVSPPGLNLGQGVMRFSNADFGSIEMFAVPVGWVDPSQGNNSPIYYQACFN